MNNDRPIIIIKKKAAHHGGHHGGAWKVAYADFVTAMMAFFLVMWILGLSQETRKAIAAYFNDPVGMVKLHPGGSSPQLMQRESTKARHMIAPAHSALLTNRAEREQFKAVKRALEKLIAEKPQFKALRKFVEITITREGLRIELMEAQSSLFFKTGSATLQPKTVELLGLIARRLAALPNSIVMEGHTDSRAYPAGDASYSNWELSADRANSARRAMTAILRPNQVAEVRGYADHKLRSPADPYHFSNRRISILMPYSHRADGAPSREVGVPDFGDTVPDFKDSSQETGDSKQETGERQGSQSL